MRLRTIGILSMVCALAVTSTVAADADWPSYNRTLSGNRYSALADINRSNVKTLKVACAFDTGIQTSFQSGIIAVGGVLYGTTEMDTFAINPGTCVQKWRTHESYKSASPLKVNRGVAYLDGRLFRGTQDGRVLAYEATTGKRLWEAQIADPKMGETVPAAPVAWNGLVFVGNAGGDNKGVKGRMYALDAASGKTVWKFDMVPANAGADRVLGWGNAADVPVTGGATWTSYTLDPVTGLLYVPGGNPAPDFDHRLRPGNNLYTGSIVVLDAKAGTYKTHYSIAPADYHDADVSTAPTLLTTRTGRHLVAEAPKDGYLHAFDLQSGKRLYTNPITRIENRSVPFSEHPVHFCPGTQGGSEWNGAAYDPATNLIYTGAVDWCATVTLAPERQTKRVQDGKPWSGNDAASEKETFGKLDPPASWAGWIYATDADSGATSWKFKTPFPVMSGVTPTAGGLVFVGDMGGTFYALDAQTGQTLWSQKIGGAVGGGVITYQANAVQRIAVATGMTSPIWPTEKTTAKIIVLSVAAR
jgi:alcohol dehydrogenase (cytochrome c)